MAGLHSLLRVQLAQQGLSDFASPEELVRVWPSILSTVSRTYVAADSFREAVERDLASSSYEKKLLADKLLRLQEELSQQQEQLDYYRRHDPLTGLLNRHEFIKRLAQVLESRQPDDIYGLLIFDLDRFKVINDSCGHAGGDALLREVANLVKHKIQGTKAAFARTGGDEFAILLRADEEKTIVALAENIRDTINKFQFEWDGTNFSLALSLGLLLLDRELDDPYLVLTRADKACHLAKDEGRNRICVFEEQHIDVAKHSQEILLLNEINQALEDNRFVLYAQPIVALKEHDACQVHYEILLRMLDEDDNILLPNTFLPVAERYNLMPVLDRWVVSNTCTVLARQREHLQKLSFCTINLSGQSVTCERFYEFLLDRIQSIAASHGKGEALTASSPR